MDKTTPRGAPTYSVPTDSEIEAAAEKLRENWKNPSAPKAHPRPAATSRTQQSLASGRTHAVTVEVKRTPRRPRDSRNAG